MAKSIRIFKSFEEQEQYHKAAMLETTARERFRQLYIMQEMTKLLHPSPNTLRKITVRNGHSE